MQKVTFSLDVHEYISLCDLLKFTGVVDSGGQAKMLIADGLVLRNGEVELRKTAKIRVTEQIQIEDIVIDVVA